MSKSKLTLIVDGNWLLMSRLAVLSNKYLDDYDLCHNLKLVMIKSMKLVLKQFPDIDNIIFVADGGSWRNKLDIPKVLAKDDIKYKGTRVRDESFNWDLLFSSFDDFMSLLNTTGITTCREPEVEGDDWCFYWSKYLNSLGTNCIIWSKDKDLTQLVSMNKNNCFTIWWNKDSGIIAKDTPEEDLDFLFNSEYNVNSEIYNNICKKSKIINKINPKDVVISKILKGDTSDNIIPLMLRKAKSADSKKQFKISSKDINYDLDIFNKKEVTNYFETLLESKAYKNRINESLDEILEHFEYNKRLVYLDKTSYPENILETFKHYKDFNISKDITIAENQLVASSNKLQGILDII